VVTNSYQTPPNPPGTSPTAATATTFVVVAEAGKHNLQGFDGGFRPVTRPAFAVAPLGTRRVAGDRREWAARRRTRETLRTVEEG